MSSIIPFIALSVGFAAILFLAPLSGKKRKTGLILLVIAVLAELFVFNFKAVLSLGNSPFALEKDKAVITELSGGKSEIVSFEGLRERIATLRVIVSMSDETTDENGNKTDKCNVVTLTVDATDETQSESFRRIVSDHKIIRGIRESEYVKVNLSGECDKLRLTLNADAGSVSVDSVDANVRLPFVFSYLRLLLIFGLSFGAYLLLSSSVFKKPLESSPAYTKRLTLALTAVFLLFAVVLTMIYNLDRTGYAFSNYRSDSGNQISKELVDAFRAGQISLLDKPSDGILAMENPYDWNARINANVSYKWDHLLYDGKYYSYYGIAPVILLFLPYNIITGHYFPTPASVLLFGGIGILFLSLLFYEFAKRFMPKMKTGVYLSSLMILQFASGIWYCFESPLFYEIAQSAGFCFTVLGFYCLIRSNVFTADKLSLPSLVLSSVFLSLAVMSRPTTAVYCFCAVLIIILEFFRRKKAEGFPAKYAALFFVCSLVGFVVLGSAQMAYNYARFGSFTDFGIQYSLTINDFTRAEFHFDQTLIGFYNYLIAFPVIKPEFPFILSNYSTLGVSGYYFTANTNAIGIFFRALPSLGLFRTHSLIKALDKDKRKYALPVLISVCILCPLIIIFSIWESGYGVRYAADFSWQMILGGIFVLYALKKDRLSEKFFTFSAICACLVFLALAYSYFSPAGSMKFDYLALKGVFEFWK